MTTYKFLGELFFQFLLHESENYTMTEIQLRELEARRFEILKMYELAGVARRLAKRNDLDNMRSAYLNYNFNFDGF